MNFQQFNYKVKLLSYITRLLNNMQSQQWFYPSKFSQSFFSYGERRGVFDRRIAVFPLSRFSRSRKLSR